MDVLGEMWGQGGHELGEDADGLAAGARGAFDGGNEFVEFGDRDVEGEGFQRLGDGGNGAVDGAPKIVVFGGGIRGRGNGLCEAPDPAP